MKITNKWLKEKSACSEGVEWFKKQKETDGLQLVKDLIKDNKLNWANWLIVRLMAELGTVKGYRMYVSYAIFAAEQVIEIYEKKYPNDKRPRQAIKAAKECVKNSNKKNNAAANAAAYAAAYAAANAAVKIKILEYGVELLNLESKIRNKKYKGDKR